LGVGDCKIHFAGQLFAGPYCSSKYAILTHDSETTSGLLIACVTTYVALPQMRHPLIIVRTVSQGIAIESNHSRYIHATFVAFT
jgi:hypothetical protein